MFDAVYDNLYVGDFEAIQNQDTVKEEGITAIVRLDMADRKRWTWGKGFTVLDAGFSDERSIPDGIIPKVTGFIYQQIEDDQIVLVHCAAGISRSVSLTMAYLIEYEGMSLPEAFGTVREGRTTRRIMIFAVWFEDPIWTLKTPCSRWTCLKPRHATKRAGR